MKPDVLKSWKGFPRDTVNFPSIPRGSMSSYQAWYRVERIPVFEARERSTSAFPLGGGEGR